jgi:hypothetical protein
MGARREFIALAIAAISWSALSAASLHAATRAEFTTDFNLQDCTFSTTGRNPFFVLAPGYRLTLEGVEDSQRVELLITVLPRERSITLPGVGRVMTRVVEERESVDGELSEISRNFFAICEQTNSVFYFGEEVDFYEGGQIVGHGGAWQAGIDGAAPGISMPGTFLLGSRYYQEIAPGVAMDRAEHVAMGLTFEVPAGRFTRVVQVKETTPLEPHAREFKLYAPGVGIIVDGVLKLVDVFDPSR